MTPIFGAVGSDGLAQFGDSIRVKKLPAIGLKVGHDYAPADVPIERSPGDIEPPR